eukprot:PhM_4_TR18845/c1_g1_i1/m.100323
MGNTEIRPIRREANYEICALAQGSPSALGIVQTSAASAEEGITDSALAEARKSDVARKERLHPHTTTKTLGAHTGGPNIVGDTEVCGPCTRTARGKATDENVSSVERDRRWCSDARWGDALPVIDPGMVSGGDDNLVVNAGYGCVKCHDYTYGRLTSAPTTKKCTAPLGKITTNRIGTEHLQRLRGMATVHELGWLRWLDDKDLYTNVKRNNNNKLFSRQLYGEVQYLKDCNVVRIRTPRVVVPGFKVDKKDETARLILDCRRVNEQLPRPPPMPIRSILDVVDDWHAKSWFGQIDATSFFYQFELGGGVEDIIGMRCAGKHGKFVDVTVNVLPMGLSYAPGVAQTAANIVCRRAMSTLGPNVTLNAWVDNFIIAAETEEACQQALNSVLDACSFFNIEVKAPEGPAQSMNMLGMNVSHSD